MIAIPVQNRWIGYARVSTYRQTLDAQMEQFRAAGCGDMYCEKRQPALARIGANC